jgi:hypothetical protein
MSQYSYMYISLKKTFEHLPAVEVRIRLLRIATCM